MSEEKLIEDAVRDLSRAANALVAVSYTHPWTPIPRPQGAMAIPPPPPSSRETGGRPVTTANPAVAAPLAERDEPQDSASRIRGRWSGI